MSICDETPPKTVSGCLCPRCTTRRAMIQEGELRRLRAENERLRSEAATLRAELETLREGF